MMSRLVFALLLFPVFILAQNILGNASFDEPILIAGMDIDPPAEDGSINTEGN